jgi:hypothetical protein
MARAFTHYWKNSTWERNDKGNNLLGHTASNLFKKRGVEAGDSIFIVTIEAGQLYVGCVLQVDRVVGRRAAQMGHGRFMSNPADFPGAVLARFPLAGGF